VGAVHRPASWRDALHADDRQAIEDAWRLSVAEASIMQGEFRLRRRDGNYRWMSVRGVPIRDEGGRVTEWVGTVTDTTETRAADEARARLAAIVASRRTTRSSARRWMPW
jgi:PAS domain S-box-containing protein